MIKCKICGEKIIFQGSDEEPRRISGEPVCDECYFNSLGEAIEKYPLGSPFYKEYSTKIKRETDDQKRLREDILNLSIIYKINREEVLETLKKITDDIKTGNINNPNWEKVK